MDIRSSPRIIQIMWTRTQMDGGDKSNDKKVEVYIISKSIRTLPVQEKMKRLVSPTEPLKEWKKEHTINSIDWRIPNDMKSREMMDC